MDWCQSQTIFREVKEAVFVRHKFEATIKAIRSAVELTGEVLAATLLVPDDFIAAMRAHVMEGPDLIIFAPDNNY